VRPEDISVSFGVVSLFPTVLMMESLELLNRHFGEDTIAHSKPPSILSLMDSIMNKQMASRWASPSPQLLSRVLDQAMHKPLCWHCCVDDMFVICQHGLDKLKTLEFLNSFH
jgi:hypothetical protein